MPKHFVDADAHVARVRTRPSGVVALGVFSNGRIVAGSLVPAAASISGQQIPTGPAMQVCSAAESQ
jgi:hypothetical protein